MIALLDLDLVAYRCAASANEEPNEVSFQRADTLIRSILLDTGASKYQGFLSGSENFRKVINPEYKANRKDQVPPLWLQETREFLITEWGAKLTHGIEADDTLGINQKEDTIICSLDKDLKMIPGKHYSWEIRGTKPNGDQWIKPATFTEVSVEAGNEKFWQQMLIGDTTDNILGVKGIGPVKAEKLICNGEDQDYFEIVLEKYNNDYDRFAMNAACLWILREENSSWHKDLSLTLPDELKLLADQTFASMKSLMVGT